MKLLVGNKTYYIGFRHDLIEGGRVRQRPSYNELVGALILSQAMAGNAAEGVLKSYQSVGLNPAEAIDNVLDRVVGSMQPISHVTDCYIKTWEVKNGERELITSGSALCDKRDQFEYATGRLLAFLKAVQAMPESQWEDFFKGYDKTGIGYPKDWGKFITLCHGKDYANVARALFNVKDKDGTIRPMTEDEMVEIACGYVSFNKVAA